MDQQTVSPWGPVREPPPLPVIPAAAPERLAFTGDRPIFRRLVVRGGLLELVTFGFYRFWLATDIRRHLWSSTGAGGDRGEYDGRAKELVIGFLFAVAILGPVYLGYFLVGLEAERLQAFLSLPFVLFFFVFVEFARYRARRYRVTRTIWRGLRFGMGGSAWGYAGRSLFWTAVVSVTGGIAWGWRQADLERFKMRHTAYGTLQGSFHGTGGELMRRIWWMMPVGLLSVPLLIPLPFLYAAFRAIEWRWWMNGLRMGEVHFHCDLPASGLFGCYWKVVGWLVLLLGLAVAWSAGVLYAMSSILGSDEAMDAEQFLAILQHPAALVSLAIGYLVFATAIGMVMRLYLVRDIWAKVAAKTTVLGLSAADGVVGQSVLVGSLGEGLSDGLDIGF